MKNKNMALVVLSGGMDSVTTLYKALEDSAVIGAVHFHYGQKHDIERECAEYHTKKLGIELYDLSAEAFSQIGDSALLKGGDSCVNNAHPTLAHLPASFVPGRNLIFLTYAAALAMKLGATEIWTGVCQTDYSGYPDCRQTSVNALANAIQRGMDFPDLEIVTPLMHLNKAQTFALAKELGVLRDVREHTHTCYNGDHETYNEWGYGCGNCDACRIRSNGYLEFISNL
jgi:7-cyano-7-deazaguanine synthase